MEITKLKRTIYFEKAEEKDNVMFNYTMAWHNWKLKDRIRVNSIELKKTLGITDIIQVQIKVLNSVDESNEELRLYIYKTGHCDVTTLHTEEVSHALQVSLGNEISRNSWVAGEDGFTAKVFPHSEKMFICLIEDVVLDIQMFYFYGLNAQYKDYLDRRRFSEEKVQFLAKQQISSYLGEIEDTQYISLASFCRGNDQLEIDYNKYKEMWEKFVHEIQIEGETIESVKQIVRLHPKGGQLSQRKIERLLKNMPSGRYILVRAEKKPKNKKQRTIMKNRFGMEKWKNGKIKLVPLQYKYTYQKMMPYVSLYEINWVKAG